MGADLRECCEQVKRLSSKPFFTAEYAMALVNVLYEYAESDAHVRLVIDAAIIRKFGPKGKEEDRCPGPADMYELIHEVTAPRERQLTECNPGCADCGGSAWRTVIRGGISGVQRCPCGEKPASPASMQAYWETEKRRIATQENDAYKKWVKEFALDMESHTRPKSKQTPVPPTQAEIDAIKAAQERNRTRHEALEDLARAEMAEGLYDRAGEAGGPESNSTEAARA